MLQKELEHTPSVKTDAAAAFLASLEDPKFTSLAEAVKKPPIEILPPGMLSLSAPAITTIKKKPIAASTTQGPPPTQSPEATTLPSDTTTQSTANSDADKPLMLEAPPPVDQTDQTDGNTPLVAESSNAPAPSVAEPSNDSTLKVAESPSTTVPSPEATESPTTTGVAA